MGAAEYDGIEGIFRIFDAGRRPQTFAVEVLTFHAAVEYELGVVLRDLLPNPDELLSGKPKLNFAMKARLLCALWKGDPADAARLNAVLRAFENLRNEVAHPGGGSLKGVKANLTQAFLTIRPNASDDPSMLEIAQGISLFIAGDPLTGTSWKDALQRYADLVIDRGVSDRWNRFLNPG